MRRIRQLIGEIHRRSLWQVLSIYLVGSWVALQVVETITESAGLPDWVQPFSLILLTIGLPIVMATAVVQEGMSGRVSDAHDASPSGPLGASGASGPRSAAADPDPATGAAGTAPHSCNSTSSPRSSTSRRTMVAPNRK